MAHTAVPSTNSSRSRAHAANGSGDGLHARLEEWRDEFAEADRQLRTTARERPFLVVGAALLGGYLLGRALARRW